jgi:hypothetical protein
MKIKFFAAAFGKPDQYSVREARAVDSAGY